jgi:hypothetical protein
MENDRLGARRSLRRCSAVRSASWILGDGADFNKRERGTSKKIEILAAEQMKPRKADWSRFPTAAQDPRLLKP